MENCFIESKRLTSAMIAKVNWVPVSFNICFETPSMQRISMKASVHFQFRCSWVQLILDSELVENSTNVKIPLKLKNKLRLILFSFLLPTVMAQPYQYLHFKLYIYHRQLDFGCSTYQIRPSCLAYVAGTTKLFLVCVDSRPVKLSEYFVNWLNVF